MEYNETKDITFGEAMNLLKQGIKVDCRQSNMDEMISLKMLDGKLALCSTTGLWGEIEGVPTEMILEGKWTVDKSSYLETIREMTVPSPSKIQAMSREELERWHERLLPFHLEMEFMEQHCMVGDFIKILRFEDLQSRLKECESEQSD